jgi:hypothetical protein
MSAGQQDLHAALEQPMASTTHHGGGDGDDFEVDLQDPVAKTLYGSAGVNNNPEDCCYDGH